jgi:hypothetical protein
MNISNSNSRLKEIRKLVANILSETEIDIEGQNAIRAIGDSIGEGFCDAAINGNTAIYAEHLKENFLMSIFNN